MSLIVKIIAQLILLIIVLPMWIGWLILDLARFGTDYKKYMLYDLFIKSL